MVNIEDLCQFPGHLLRRAQQASTAIFGEEVDTVDLTSVQFMALVAIKDRPGIDATAISALIALDRATIGGVLERLSRKGLIQREESPHDRRAKLLRITAPGLALLESAYLPVQRVQARLLQALSEDERIIFLTLLRRLVESPHRGSPDDDA